MKTLTSLSSARFLRRRCSLCTWLWWDWSRRGGRRVPKTEIISWWSRKVKTTVFSPTAPWATRHSCRSRRRTRKATIQASEVFDLVNLRKCEKCRQQRRRKRWCRDFLTLRRSVFDGRKLTTKRRGPRWCFAFSGSSPITCSNWRWIRAKRRLSLSSAPPQVCSRSRLPLRFHRRWAIDSQSRNWSRSLWASLARWWWQWVRSASPTTHAGSSSVSWARFSMPAIWCWWSEKTTPTRKSTSSSFSGLSVCGTFCCCGRCSSSSTSRRWKPSRCRTDGSSWFSSWTESLARWFLRRFGCGEFDNSPQISRNFTSNFRGCFLTSTLIGTLAMTLQIPMSMVLDMILRDKIYPLNFYLGSIPMFLSLIFVAFLMKFDDSDPVLRCLKIIYRRLRHCRRANIVKWVTKVLHQENSITF